MRYTPYRGRGGGRSRGLTVVPALEQRLGPEEHAGGARATEVNVTGCPLRSSCRIAARAFARVVSERARVATASPSPVVSSLWRLLVDGFEGEDTDVR